MQNKEKFMFSAISAIIILTIAEFIGTSAALALMGYWIVLGNLKNK